jgi:signal transduction histidine kinase
MSARDDLVAFARHAAHDLNNTVAALSMAVELAIDELPDDSDDLSSLLERVQRCAGKIAATVDALPGSAETWPLED